MINFNIWLENLNKSVVSFDFDGVLHSDVYPGTIHPIDFHTTDLNPRLDMFSVVKQESIKNKIIVVSARHSYMKRYMDEFIINYNLPISETYVTKGLPKKPLLLKLNVIRHYDDNIKMKKELRGSGIEFVYVPSEDNA